jgi:hypothetical protein
MRRAKRYASFLRRKTHETLLDYKENLKENSRELQRYYISDEQRAEYNVAKVEVTTNIYAIENEKTQLKKAIAVKKAILTQAKNAADKYRKIRGKIGAPARLHIK